jgi:hypothetical protein
MIQLSLFVFCVGGAALSMAYYDVFFIWAGLLSALLFGLRRSLLLKGEGQATRSIEGPAPALARAEG